MASADDLGQPAVGVAIAADAADAGIGEVVSGQEQALRRSALEELAARADGELALVVVEGAPARVFERGVHVRDRVTGDEQLPLLRATAAR